MTTYPERMEVKAHMDDTIPTPASVVQLYAIARANDGEIIWAGVVDADKAQEVAVAAAVNNGNVNLLSGEDLGRWLSNHSSGDTCPPRYRWHGWAEETENENDDDREGVYYLTITDDGEEMAVIVHRTVDGKFPIDGAIAGQKIDQAKRIVAALNAFEGN